MCKGALATSPGAPTTGLVKPWTKERSMLAQAMVSSVGAPHWLDGDDMPNGIVSWGGEVDAAGAEALWGARNKPYPWHTDSGQPNDCDGPGTEPCMFMGPSGRWFDFACASKEVNKTKGVTAGPEITWEDGVRREYRVHPMCEGVFTMEQIKEAFGQHRVITTTME